MNTDSHHPQTPAANPAGCDASRKDSIASCSCHEHHRQCHAQEPHTVPPFLLPGLSFVLLATGIVLGHLGAAWYAQPAVRLSWFVAAFLPVGLPVMKEAWEAMREKDIFNEFLLMTIASIGAFCIGEYPEAVAVMLFYTIGETLQDKAVDKATRNIGSLLDMRPTHADVLRGDGYISVQPQAVRPGERIEVKPGGHIPLDGTLLEEEALFDTSALTGESLPRIIRKDGQVLAGMIVAGQAVHIHVTHPYEQSELARILDMVKDAAGRKAPAERFIRRFARIYTPIVILLAVLIATVPAMVAAWLPSFHYVFEDWLYRGLVFLVISCPCALVISVPLGYFAGIGRASRNGILFKGGNYLDAITHVNCIAFDKTGTLTTGRFQVDGIRAQQLSEQALLSLVAAVEKKSTHPIAQAIADYAKQQGIAPATVDSICEVAGHGMVATADGRQVLVGNRRLLEERGIDLPGRTDGQSLTTVFCAIDGTYAGAISLSDALKDDASAAIGQLKALGIDDLVLLSGDKKETVEKYARELGIAKAFGELLPEDKSAYVEQAARQPGRTIAFVGDGINDAPVLALSNVGIAMGGLGSDAAIESADVVIQTDQPSKVATAIRIGRITRGIVRQNIVGAIAVKVAVLLAGTLGYASLWGAVFADVGVAVLAVLNAVRILGKRV